jgi:hypothetical protein
MSVTLRPTTALSTARWGPSFSAPSSATSRTRSRCCYIIVFFTLPIVIVVGAVVFAACWASATRRRTINGAAIALAAIVAFAFVLLSAMTLGSGLERWMIWRDMQLVLTICASALAVVVAQWLIFRWLSEPGAANGGPAGSSPDPVLQGQGKTGRGS